MDSASFFIRLRLQIVAYIRIVLIFRRLEDQREGTTVLKYVSELSSNTSTRITTRRGMVSIIILYLRLVHPYTHMFSSRAYIGDPGSGAALSGLIVAAHCVCLCFRQYRGRNASRELCLKAVGLSEGGKLKQ